MKKITITQRITLDLSFFQNLPKQVITEGLVKRVEVAGSGEVIRDIKIPCMIYFSYYKYNYEGRFIQHRLNSCIRDLAKRSNSQFPPGIYLAIQSMRVQQKSWFNFRTEELHQNKSLLHKGCHYYIVVQQIKYKNSDNLESKKLVSQRCREEGKKFYETKDYEKAMKCYQRQINITHNFDMKKYNEKQIQEVQAINLKAKANMLRCFGKIAKVDQNLCELADNYSKQLLKKRNNDDLSIFLRSKVLLQRKYLTNALDLAKELIARGNPSGVQLANQIKQKIKNKNNK